MVGYLILVLGLMLLDLWSYSRIRKYSNVNSQAGSFESKQLPQSKVLFYMFYIVLYVRFQIQLKTSDLPISTNLRSSSAKTKSQIEEEAIRNSK